MRIDVVTLFPQLFDGPMTESMLWKARDQGMLDLRFVQIRDFTTDRHRTADDTPYGGGGGMIMKTQPVMDAIAAAMSDAPAKTPVILMSPQGRVFNHAIAKELSYHERLILVCGRYEGIDDRVRQLVITDEISIGDYVLTGGELAAMVIIDAVVRHIPGVLGAEGAADRDSHANGLLEAPHYTRPPVFEGIPVPAVLLEGNHLEIQRWRRRESLRRTWRSRPDLLLSAPLSEEDRYLLAEFAEEDAARLRTTGTD